MKEVATQVLKDYNLSVTSPRLSVLAILLPNPSKAFTCQDFISNLGHKMDRSTIYRTLETLMEKDVIHKMTGPNGNNLYSFHAGKECNHQTHPHLKCTECGTIECLPQFPPEYVNELTSSGFHEINVMLNGICKTCQ